MTPEMESPFDELIGTKWVSDDPEAARVQIEVRRELMQPTGLVHGGVLSTLVESVCSRATAVAVLPDGMMAMGQSLDLNYLRPVTEGAIDVTARARHRGRTTWIWDAEVTDARGRVCALGRMTLAVRPLPGS